MPVASLGDAKNLDYGALPPEINSGRMYAGAGPGSLLSAAGAWNTLAAELYAAAHSLQSVISELSGPWQGPSSAAMVAAAAPYVAWMHATAAQVQQTAAQATAAVAAYDAAFAATVPPPVIAANRAELAALVATNVLGQNTAAIMATQTRYAEMWAQDAAAMYGYAANSASAAMLKPFTAPPQTTNPAGQAGQASAVAQAARTPAGTSVQSLSQLTSTLPHTLQSLASGGPSGLVTSAAASASSSGSSVASVASAVGDYLTFLSGVTFIVSGVLFIVSPIIQFAANASPSGGSGGGSGSGGGAGTGGGPSASANSPGAGTTSAPGSGVLAGMGRATPVGRLSTPPAWAEAAPAARSTATSLPEVALTGSSDEPGGFGLGPGVMGPAGLTAAAAGGGGAAGSGWASQRAAAQRAGKPAPPQGGAAARYGYRPAVLPAVAAADPREGAQSPGAFAGPRASDGDGAPDQSLREELNSLRKQVADMAMERDVLMRSAAMWAQQAMERPDS